MKYSCNYRKDLRTMFWDAGADNNTTKCNTEGMKFRARCVLGCSREINGQLLVSGGWSGNRNITHANHIHTCGGPIIRRCIFSRQCSERKLGKCIGNAKVIVYMRDVDTFILTRSVHGGVLGKGKGKSTGV